MRERLTEDDIAPVVDYIVSESYSENSTTGSTAFSDRITGELQEKAGSYRSIRVQEGR